MVWLNTWKLKKHKRVLTNKIISYEFITYRFIEMWKADYTLYSPLFLLNIVTDNIIIQVYS